jgi:hypothetical protein
MEIESFWSIYFALSKFASNNQSACIRQNSPMSLIPAVDSYWGQSWKHNNGAPASVECGKFGQAHGSKCRFCMWFVTAGYVMVKGPDGLLPHSGLEKETVFSPLICTRPGMMSKPQVQAPPCWHVICPACSEDVVVVISTSTPRPPVSPSMALKSRSRLNPTSTATETS